MSNGGGSDFLSIIVLLIAGYCITMWIVAAVILAVTAVYYAALYVTFALSVLCLLTLKHRVRIGRLSLGPEQSQPFIARGVVGAILLPVFGVCCHLFLDRHVPGWMWPHLFAVGWALGSVGIGAIEDDLVLNSRDYDRDDGPVIEHERRAALPGPREEQRPASTSLVRREGSQAPEQQEKPARKCQCFTFATWDDEEEMRARAAQRAAREKKDTDPTMH
ncbi:hypothetical protein [Methylobacterium komagatae]